LHLFNIKLLLLTQIPGVEIRFHKTGLEIFGWALENQGANPVISKFPWKNGPYAWLGIPLALRQQ
jgi:hypothetical protein